MKYIGVTNRKLPAQLYIDDRAYKYFTDNFNVDLLSNDNQGIYIYKNQWEKIYSDKMSKIKEYLNSNQEKYIKMLHDEEINDVWEESCNGNLSSWEMETLGFYYNNHELKNCYHP